MDEQNGILLYTDINGDQKEFYPKTLFSNVIKEAVDDNGIESEYSLDTALQTLTEEVSDKLSEDYRVESKKGNSQSTGYFPHDGSGNEIGWVFNPAETTPFQTWYDCGSVVKLLDKHDGAIIIGTIPIQFSTVYKYNFLVSIEIVCRINQPTSSFDPGYLDADGLNESGYRIYHKQYSGWDTYEDNNIGVNERVINDSLNINTFISGVVDSERDYHLYLKVTPISTRTGDFLYPFSSFSIGSRAGEGFMHGFIHTIRVHAA